MARRPKTPPRDMPAPAWPSPGEAPSNALIAHLAADPPCYTIERLARLYSDGSISVTGDGPGMIDNTIEGLREGCLYDDKNETDPAHFTRIVRVRLEILEHVETPSAAKAGETCPTCGQSHPRKGFTR